MAPQQAIVHGRSGYLLRKLMPQLFFIAAHTILATSPYDDYYHTINDEIATIDFPMMSSLLRAIAIASTDLISGAATPKVSGYIPDFE